MPEHPPVEKILFGMPIRIDFEKGMKLPEEFNLSTNWPLFADFGHMMGTRDPMDEESEILVMVGNDFDFTPNVFICVVNVKGQRRTVVFLGVHSLEKAMMIKAGIYLSTEVERIIERDVHTFANEIRTFGTVRLGEQVELIVGVNAGGSEHEDENDEDNEKRETASVF